MVADMSLTAPGQSLDSAVLGVGGTVNALIALGWLNMSLHCTIDEAPYYYSMTFATLN